MAYLGPFGGLHLGGFALQRVLVDIGHHDLGAAVAQTSRDGQADAVRGTCHDSHLSR